MDNLFDLMDKEITDLKDLPSFKVPDTGNYRLFVQGTMKEINDKPSYVASFTVRELIELDDPESVPEEERAKPDDKFDVPFILKDEDGKDSEMAWGRLKEFAAPFSEHFGVTNLKALLTGPLADGVEITAKVKKVQRKNDKEKFDARVSDIAIS